MQFILTGFTHEMGFRVFAFECVSKSRPRSAYSVKADLGLLRRYGIRMQELPILCREVLERLIEGDVQRAFTYTEADMSRYAGECASRDAEAKRKKAYRKPVSENVGSAWRGRP